MQVIVGARRILGERGWAYVWTDNPDSPLNIRSAVSCAATELCAQDWDRSDWAKLYRDAVAAISAHIGEGIQAWEFGTRANKPRRRTEAEVFEMLDTLIASLEGAVL